MQAVKDELEMGDNETLNSKYSLLISHLNKGFKPEVSYAMRSAQISSSAIV